MNPEFRQQLEAYLQERPNVPFQTWLANKNAPAPVTPDPVTPLNPIVSTTPTAPTTPAPEPVTSPTERKPDMLDRILASMLPPVMQNGSFPKGQAIYDTWANKVREGLIAKYPQFGKSESGDAADTPPPVAPPVPGMLRPPPGYRYGVDPEFNYGFLPPVKFEKPEDKASGGIVTYMYDGGSSGTRSASPSVSRPDSGGSNPAPASAGKTVDLGKLVEIADRQTDGSNGSYGGRSVNLNKLLDVAAKDSADREYLNFWDRINGGGPGAGYKNPLDWINGGGMGGSYANPGTNIRGLGAVVNDLQQGGISALLRDAVNGGGLGASGDNFRGGKRAIILNALGVNPAGDNKSIFNSIPEASPELEAQWAASQRYNWKPDKGKNKFNLNNLFGTKGTEETKSTADKSAGGVIRYAKGGITDLAARRAPAQPPMGNEKDLISSAIAAIKGQVEDPRPVLGAFLAKYGEEALRNLVDKVESGDVDKTAARSEGMLKGPGDGMNDRIPAKVEGGHDVLLANNEYIVPADVVSALGNGSSDAGAEQMDKMLDRIRTAAHGKSTQQKKVTAEKVLPA